MKKISYNFKNIATMASVGLLTSFLFVKDAFAQPTGGTAGFPVPPAPVPAPIVDDSAVTDNLSNLNNWVNSIFTILSGVALAWFIFNIVRFVIANGPEDKDKAKSALLWSFIGLFLTVAIWGAVRFVAASLGFEIGGTGPRVAI